MRKTLLLVFIHGFKGDDNTFGTFPEHLRALLSHALPKVDIVTISYPRFETRGELKECVARLREWLENKVIDVEVAHSTPSPTIDPSVHTILIGHSMGGIVAAEVLLALAEEKPLPFKPRSESGKATSPTTNDSGTSTSATSPTLSDSHNLSDSVDSHVFMFPHIQGVLTFDTPFLGIAPSLVAHGAEGHFKTASSAYATLTETASLFGWGSGSGAKGGANGDAMTGKGKAKIAGALPPATSAVVEDAAATPRWQSWGKYAMFAGAAGAAATALYSQRERLSAGLSWATSHLEFVSCLARPEELRKRVERLAETGRERGIGLADLYTALGRGGNDSVGVSQSAKGVMFPASERTFCSLPRSVRGGGEEGHRDGTGDPERTVSPSPSSSAPGGLRWYKAVNDKARDETTAHMSMFFPRDNPGFYALGHRAKELIVSWVDRGWYEGSEELQQEKGKTRQSGGMSDRAQTSSRGEADEEEEDEWEKADYTDDHDHTHDLKRRKSFSHEWEGVDGVKDLDVDGNGEVQMTDEVGNNGAVSEELRDSIIVDVASPSKKKKIESGVEAESGEKMDVSMS